MATTSRGPEFAINGRFASQSMTGVQRYAREVTRSMDAGLIATGTRAICYVPRNATPPKLDFRAIQVESVGYGTGHLWEQAALPSVCRFPLLNLCNTGPLSADNRVVCIHDTNIFSVPESYSFAFRTAYRQLLPRLGRKSTFVATVSNDAATKLSYHLGIPSARIFVLPNGSEHALEWNPDNATLDRSVIGKRPYVLIIGSLAKHKNISRVVSLANKLGEIGIGVKVVGSAGSVFSPGAQVDEMGVELLGRVSDDDLALLLDHALCLAFPSMHEGFGIPVLEAMARGCPVVASDCSSLPEVCGNAALLADPCDGDAWLRHFTRLAGSTDLRQEMSEKGRRRSRDFSWAASAQGYLELMRR